MSVSIEKTSLQNSDFRLWFNIKKKNNHKLKDFLELRQKFMIKPEDVFLMKWPSPKKISVNFDAVIIFLKTVIYFLNISRLF